ncbi:MAG: hypothetical protein ACC645_13375 [Pirellulales bacterium]
MMLGALRYELNEETAGPTVTPPDRLASWFGVGVGDSHPTGYITTEEKYFVGRTSVHDFTEDNLTGPPVGSYRSYVDEDGNFDFDDIAGFVAVLNTPLTSEAQAIPEPTAVYLACVGLLGITWLRSSQGHTCEKPREAPRA